MVTQTTLVLTAQGLPGFVAMCSMKNNTGTLAIVGPKGLREYCESVLKWSDTFVKAQLSFHELEPGHVADLGLLDDQLSVRVIPIQPFPELFRIF